MIRRAHRFHGYNSLQYVYKNGQSVRGAVLATRYANNTRRQTYRAAVVVSKKVHKSAVVRNRIRRRIYELVRKHEVLITTPLDLVITIFSAGVADMPVDKLEEELTQQLKKIAKMSRRQTEPRATIEQKEN